MHLRLFPLVAPVQEFPLDFPWFLQGIEAGVELRGLRVQSQLFLLLILMQSFFIHVTEADNTIVLRFPLKGNKPGPLKHEEIFERAYGVPILFCHLVAIT